MIGWANKSLIIRRLLTFREVAELHERNIEVLAVGKELSCQHKEHESSLVEEKTAELRQELELVQEFRETQEVMREIQEMEQEQQPSLGPAALATKKSQVK